MRQKTPKLSEGRGYKLSLRYKQFRSDLQVGNVTIIQTTVVAMTLLFMIDIVGMITIGTDATIAIDVVLLVGSVSFYYALSTISAKQNPRTESVPVEKDPDISSSPSAVQQSIVIIGDNYAPITQTNSTNGTELVDELIARLVASGLDKDVKDDIISDLNTIKSQVGKKHPTDAIIRRAWSSVQTAIDDAGTTIAVADVVAKIIPFIKQFF